MKPVKILAIDADSGNIIELSALLKMALPEAELISALTGKNGIELCLSEKPDIIILDIVLPIMDSYEVCRILKANEVTKSIPIVMITNANTDKKCRIKALEFGADAFLSKPVDEPELVAQIHAMVRIKESVDYKLDEKERLKRLVEERTSQLEAELNELSRVEKALKQSEERFQLMFNEAPLGYQSLDIEGRFIEVNQQWLDTLGFTREEVIGKWFGDFLSPEYQDAFRQRFPLFKAQGQIHSEFEMVHKNGSILFIAFEGKIGYELNGAFKQTHCILQDITQRKQAEDALTESEEKYSILFKNSPDSYLIISDGIFVDCNKATEKMLRGDRTQIVGHTPDEISPEIQPDGKKSSDSVAEKIAWAFANGKNTFEWMHRRFDSSDLYVEVSIAPMKLKGKLTLFTTWRDISTRKLTEQALKESEAQFREFFEKAADAIFIAETETGMIVDANEAACLLMQRPLNKLVGIHQAELHPPVKKDYAKDTFEKHRELVIQKESSHAFENTVVRADGKEVPVEILASNVIFQGKQCLMGTFRDITERKKSQEALHSSEANLNAIVENTLESIWSINTRYEILHINNVFVQAFYNSFGVRLAKGSNIVDALPKELKQIWKDRYDRAFKNEHFVFEDRVDLGNTIIYIEVAMNPIVIDGVVVGASFFGRDITKQKRAVEAIRISEARLNRAEIASKSGNWELYLDSHLIIGSEGARKLYGVSKDQFDYSIIKTIPLPEYRPLIDDALKNLLEKNIPYDIEFKISTVDTNEIRDIHSVAIYDPEKRVLFGIIQDITERKKAQLELISAKEKAEENDRLKSAFLANMSHELRTPLNSIIGFSELLFNPDFDIGSQKEFAQMINSSGTNLLAIISDIMDLSKIEAGQVQVNKSRFMVNQLISNIQREFSYKAYEKQIELILDPASPTNETFLESDENRIKQVLVNFVGNSIKFTANGSIKIGFAIFKGFVQFHVIDTGIGIPKDFHQYIFERFRQVDSSSSRKYGGNGLGLAISKSLVELLGGRIWMESEPGKGSAFYFTIPVETLEATE
jgi:PAS domain S-box-containing protein